MSNVPVKGADSATYQLALPSLGSTPASGALSVIPSPDGTHAKTADIIALSSAITGALAATQVVSVTGTVAVTQSGSWTVGLAPNSTVALAGGNTVALKVDGSAVTQPVSFATGASVAISNFPSGQATSVKQDAIVAAIVATGPGTDAFSVAPSDTANFTANARSLYVGTAGDVVVVTPGGSVVTFKAVPAGTTLPVIAKRVNFTATTASNIVGLV
jgi:hypothetical protein